MRRTTWVAAALLGFAGWAQALVFAVNEGVSYRVPLEEVRGRYAAIAADLTKLLKQPVTVEPVGDYKQLRAGLATRQYDVAMIHPAHISIAAMQDHGYRLLAVTKGFQGYRASFLVGADSPMTSLADLRGKRVGAPDEDSITAWMVRATLRDAKLEDGAVGLVYTRYQDAVPFFVENKLTAGGATASNALVKAWEAKGGKVLAASRPVPIKHLVANSALGPEAIAALRDYFVTLDASEDGRRKLAPTKYAGFDRHDEAELLAIGRWLGLKPASGRPHD